MKMNISKKVILSVTIAVFLILGLLGIINYNLVWSDFKSDVDLRTQWILNRLKFNLPTPLWSFDLEMCRTLLELEMQDPDVLGINLFNPEGELILASTRDAKWNTVVGEMITGNINKEKDKNRYSQYYTFEIVSEGLTIGYLELFLTDRFINNQVFILGIYEMHKTLLVIAALAIVLGFLLRRIIIKPLLVLVSDIKEIGKGNYQHPIEMKTNDEIQILGDSINSMVRKIPEYQEAAIVNARSAKELEIAARIQTSLLPRDLEHENLELTGVMITADEVGGDYYDVIKAEGRDWLIIGDVSGHGVQAGLVMMMVQTAIHVVLANYPQTPPDQLLAQINKTIVSNIKKLGDDKYMTITVIASFGNDDFIYSGMHLPMMIYRAQTKKVELIWTKGVWLGLIDDITNLNEIRSFKLHSGDCLLLYTDGVPEARSKQDDMTLYGLDHMVQLFEKLGTESTRTIVDRFIDSLKDYIIDDDVSLLAVRKK